MRVRLVESDTRADVGTPPEGFCAHGENDGRVNVSVESWFRSLEGRFLSTIPAFCGAKG